MFPEALNFLKSKHERDIITINHRVQEITQVENAKMSLDVRSLSQFKTVCPLEVSNTKKSKKNRMKTIDCLHRRTFSDRILHY